MICPNCGAESIHGSRFCADCGTPLAPGGFNAFRNWAAASTGRLIAVAVVAGFVIAAGIWLAAAMLGGGDGGELASGELPTPTATQPGNATSGPTTAATASGETPTGSLAASPSPAGGGNTSDTPTPTTLASTPTATPVPPTPTNTPVPPTPTPTNTPVPPTPTPTNTPVPPTPTPTNTPVPPTPAPGPSLVFGLVLLDFAGETSDCWDCPIRFRGPAGTYDATSDDFSEYAVNLPQGTYEVAYSCVGIDDTIFWVPVDTLIVNADVIEYDVYIWGCM